MAHHPSHVTTSMQPSQARLAQDQTPRVQAAPYLKNTLGGAQLLPKLEGILQAQRGPGRVTVRRVVKGF